MLSLRYLTSLVIGAMLFTTIAPALPAHAASANSIPTPVRQDDIADHIAEIRNEDPDIDEDFSSDSGLFDNSYDGSTSTYFRAGALHIAVDDENTFAISSLSEEAADFYAEVETTHAGGSIDNQYGFLVRIDDDGNYYLFAASSDGYYTIQTRIDDEWQPLVEWTESDSIEVGEGETNTLGLLAEGDTFAFLINDTIVDSVEDDSVQGAGLALSAAAFSEPPTEMTFDNFRLWYLGDSGAQPTRLPPTDRRSGVTPEPSSTPEPTEEATEEATVGPTEEPTEEATIEPTEETTEEATEEATVEPTEEATEEPTAEPTAEATVTVEGGTSSDPTIAAIQSQAPTFSDDFEDGDTSDWASFESDAVTYDASLGTLDFIFNSDNVLTWSELPVDATHYYVEVDATLASSVEQAEYGIIFNYLDSQNFDLFAVNNASRYSIWRLVNNSWEVVYDWADSTALLAGENNTNRLGLLVQDDSVTLSANDEVLTTLEDYGAPLGTVALAAGTFDEPDLIMSFDNVALWDLDSLDIEVLPTSEPTVEATGEPTEEPTAEPTEEATEEASGDFSAVTDRIAEITANDPDVHDEFRRDDGTWDIGENDAGTYYYEGRALNIEGTVKDRIIWSSRHENADSTDPAIYSDFYAEFDTTFVTYTGENSSGLVFRQQDTDNFYKFMVDEIGYFQLQKRVDGNYVDILEWALTDEVDDSEGAVNRIGILAEGSTLALTVNGVVVAQAEDNDLISGGIALAIQTYSTPEGHSTFDNLDLWELNQ